jgi:hypothetical protein
MNDMHFLHGIHPNDKLWKDSHRLCFLQSCVFSNVFGQISPIAELEKNVKIGLSFLDIDEVNDVIVLAVVEELNLRLKDVNLVFWI